MESDIKLIDDNGKRLDGRKIDELRKIKIEAGVLHRADGSCYLEWGSNKVVAAVYGPREALPKHTQDPLKAVMSYRYVEYLEMQSKRCICIWPYHGLNPMLNEKILNSLGDYYLKTRGFPKQYHKGLNPNSEMYGFLNDELGNKAHYFYTLTDIFSNTQGKIFVAGEAKSHCVLDSLIQINKHYFMTGIPDKVHVLTDCMSSVVHPDADFEKIANEELKALTRMKLVSSVEIEHL